SGSNVVLHVKAKVTSSAVGGVTNTAEVTTADQPDPDSTPNNHIATEDDQASVTVTPLVADLSLTKTVDYSTPNVGQTITFTITLKNDGPDTATNVAVTDALPSGLTFISSDQTSYDPSSSDNVWNIASLASGSSVVLNVKAKVT